MDSSSPPTRPTPTSPPWIGWALLASLGAILIGFYGLLPKFGSDNTFSTAAWLTSTWNSENKNYEHGWVVVAVMAFFLWKAIPKVAAEPVASGRAGLLWLALGVILWVGAFRGIQARAAALSLPCIILGVAHFVLGWRAARHLVFPLSMVIFMIPVPGFDQMTNDLAILSTKIAHKLGNVVGIETLQFGTKLHDPKNATSELIVDDGCSGIRSLMALLLVSYIYGMVAHRRWRERAIIFLAAMPVAVIANGFRITSILLLTLVNRDFALNTWHDLSGFFSFGAALACLLVLSAVIRGGIRALRPKVKVTTVQ
jgi:exosortase